MARASAPMKTPPAYAVTSVDHALRLAVVLQVEGPLTVSAAADRLGVARSTVRAALASARVAEKVSAGRPESAATAGGASPA